jgi:soluble lytic murein transglycosylase-like protein
MKVDREDWRQNLDGGARYLLAMKERFGAWAMALVAYNAGPGAAAKRGSDLSRYPQETRGYVARIRSRNEGSPPSD